VATVLAAAAAAALAGSLAVGVAAAPEVSLAVAVAAALAGPLAVAVAAAPAVRRAVAMAATVAARPGAARQVVAALHPVVAAVTALVPVALGAGTRAEAAAVRVRELVPAALRRLAARTGDEVRRPTTSAPPGGVMPVTTGAEPLEPAVGPAAAAA